MARRRASACPPESGGELIEIGLAQQHGTRLKQSGHDGGPLRAGVYAKAGHAAVVGMPATSILSLIANGTPEEWQALD